MGSMGRMGEEIWCTDMLPNKHFSNLIRALGDISSVTVLGQTIVVLNSYPFAKELLDGRSGTSTLSVAPSVCPHAQPLQPSTRTGLICQCRSSVGGEIHS